MPKYQSQDMDILRKMVQQDKSQEEVLKSIDANLQKLVDDGLDLSKESTDKIAQPKDKQTARPLGGPTTYREIERRGTNNRYNLNGQAIVRDFEDSFAKELANTLKTAGMSESLRDSVINFSDAMGSNIEDAGKDFGKLLGESISNTMADNKWVQKVKSAKEDYASKISDLVNQGAENLRSARDARVNVTESFGTFTKSLGLGTKEMSALVSTAAAAGAALVAIELVTSYWKARLQETGEKLGAFNEAAAAAAEFSHNMRQVKIQNQTERMKKDFNSMIQSSYDIMTDASQKMLQAWDDSLQTITATQGYTKSDLQDLIASYSQRLRDEGLSSYVSSADLTTNLTKVLDSGLSGKVAEEFAYIATVLNQAVPTEDFFNYASTYASIAANQIAAGKSNADAINYANQELKDFASNLLYSSRTLAQGFTTGLNNASSLLESANKIAVASKVGDVSNISGVLTSVSAIVGAVAPDLANSLVDNIVSAATSGNSSSLTAIRSLAGTGASNTAFLQALAKDPQKVFATMFSNLAGLQNMSSSNYMEVAEGLSEVFGVSMDALSRVDFNYLANAVSNMDTNNSALEENMKLLVSGQTTSTAEQQRMAEINKYMIENGLSYVLDNEVAREVQQHMWDEQLTNELKEAEYGVNLVGSSMELLESLANTVESIFNFLNPLYWLKKGGDLIAVASNTKSMDKDLKALLEAGKVGSGNSSTLYNLTTRGTDLKLAKSYLERLGQSNSTSIGSWFSKGVSTAYDVSQLLSGNVGAAVTMVNRARKNGAFNPTSSASNVTGPKSSYAWGTISKSLSSSLAKGAYDGTSAYAALPVTSVQDQIDSARQDKVQQYLNSMQQYVQDNKSYDEWAGQAKNYGITNLNAALTDYGLTEADAKKQFQDLEVQQASKYQYDQNALQNQFYQDGITFLEETWPEHSEKLYEWQDKVTEWQDLIAEKTDLQITEMVKSNRQLSDFYTEWTRYYVEHEAYSQATLHASDVAAIRNSEKSETGDAVLALADALTSNAVDLKDPAVQTNVLLAKLLQVAEAIMQQNNDTTTMSLPTALAGLGLGVTSDNM